MRCTLFTTLRAIAGLAGAAQAASAPDVILYVSGDTPAVFEAAKATVGWMFSQIGVRIGWREAGPPMEEPGDPVAIRLRFTRHPDRPANPDALAYAEPFRDRIRTITILSERLERAAGRSARTQALLAHTLAHEIGHVLEGTNAHSDSGVMKARWTAADHDVMARRPLLFAEPDVEMIREGLRIRPRR